LIHWLTEIVKARYRKPDSGDSLPGLKTHPATQGSIDEEVTKMSPKP
jgi:hypothetical protein